MEELTDLEICKKIAEIEGVKAHEFRGSIVLSEDYNEVVNSVASGRYSPEQVAKLIARWEYSPLTDDALCFQLMVKHEVEREYEPYDFIGWNCHSQKDKDPERITERTYWGEGKETPDISANKAICLAIIKAH